MFETFAKNLPRRAAPAVTIAIATAMLVSGCSTIGPDFVAPKGAEEAAFRHAPAAPADSARLSASWWTVFDDPALNELENRALGNSPGVRAAAQRLLQAQAQLGVVRAGQVPNLSVNAGVSNSRTSAETAQGQALGGRSIEGDNFSVGAALSYELDIWGRVRRIVEAADAQALA
ncbi:MAG TPA: RND transporter, partial [Massilia sp.]|nr:RND transporter [Massilia sp.]